MPALTTKKFGFDRILFRRFRRILAVLFPSLFGRTSLLFALLLTLSILGKFGRDKRPDTFCLTAGVFFPEQFLIYQTGMMPSRFYAVLGNKDRDGFYWTFLEASLYIVGNAIILSSKQYIAAVLYICWRKLLTKKLHRLYFNDKSYYILNVLDRNIDNPDQRITQDVDKMCDKCSTIIAAIIIAPFRIGYYSYNSFVTTTWIGPVSIFGYFVIGTIATKLLMSPVINFVAKQERKEGDLRFKHMQIRTNAECLAFYDSGSLEENRLNIKLHSLLAVQLMLTNLRLALNFFLNFYNYFGGILSNLIISIPIFAGFYDSLSAPDLSALISANAFVSIYLINSFTTLVDLSSDVTDIGGTAHRIGELLEDLSISKKNLDRQSIVIHRYEPQSSSAPEALEAPIFQLTDVTIAPPTDLHENLIANLTMDLREKKSVLIAGSSSCGKSSLLRVLAGLWPVKSGEIKQRMASPLSPSFVLFLPQKPYFTDGSLWQQIVFPLAVHGDLEEEEEQKIRECLDLSGSARLLERVKGIDELVTWNWYDVLSPGEMQRLVFARLFYHRPTIAFMDEATSAVSVEVEEELYRACEQLEIACVSVGHRITLRAFHDDLLELDGKGGWSLTHLIKEE